jgi:hypothetical protein
MLVPLAFILLDEYGAFEILCWTLLFLATASMGVYGIVQAFHGRRYSAVRAGLWSALPPVPIPGLPLLFVPPLIPLAAGVWAILLAYLIPEEPPF